MSNKLEQVEFKLEKKYWDLETCRKNQKNSFLQNHGELSFYGGFGLKMKQVGASYKKELFSFINS